MQIEEGYRMNAEVDNFFRLSDPDCVPLENSVLYTAISTKVVKKMCTRQSPKGNMRYAQYTVPDTSCRNQLFLVAFPLA